MSSANVIESPTEKVVNRAELTSRYNGLSFTPHVNGKGKDFATPMLMSTENGDMFDVKRGGGSGKASATFEKAPWLESKIQGRKVELPIQLAPDSKMEDDEADMATAAMAEELSARTAAAAAEHDAEVAAAAVAAYKRTVEQAEPTPAKATKTRGR